MEASVSQELEERLQRYYRERKQWMCGLDQALARFTASDMNAEEEADFARHLAGCPHCQEAMEQYQRHAGVWESAEAARPSFWTRRLFFPGLTPLSLAAAAALLLFLFVWLHPPWRAGGPDDRLHSMGAWELAVAGQRQGRIFRVTSGMPMETGDRLGFFYSSDQDGQLMILFADPAGAISVLFPAAGEKSAGVLASRDVRLPDGGLLTPGQGCEWIIGLFSLHPFREADVRGPLQTLLARRRGCELTPVEQGKPILPGFDLQWISIRRGS